MIIAISFFSIVANAVTIDYSHTSVKPKIEKCINTILGLESLPFTKAPITFKWKPCSGSCETDIEIIEIFKEINQNLFKNENTFLLQRHQDNHFASLDSNSKTVYVGNIFSMFIAIVPPHLRREFIALVLLHEIGHYFQESCIQLNESLTSPLGFKGYYWLNRDIDELGQMHGEVDLIGLFLMEKLGYSTVGLQNFINFLSSAVSKVNPKFNPRNPYVYADHQNRKKIIQEYFSIVR